jgi:hypothetical protein
LSPETVDRSRKLDQFGSTQTSDTLGRVETKLFDGGSGGVRADAKPVAGGGDGLAHRLMRPEVLLVREGFDDSVGGSDSDKTQISAIHKLGRSSLCCPGQRMIGDSQSVF